MFGTEKYSELINASVAKILADFIILHFHPNNCGGQVQIKDLVFPRVLEIIFIRWYWFKPSETSAKLPHSLDRKNCNELNEIHL